LAGQAFFRWALSELLSWSRVLAIAALAALIPVGFATPTLALSAAAAVMVVALAVWDILSYRRRTGSPKRSPE